MPLNFIKKHLKQRAVYWSPSAGNDDFGKPIWGDPEEIICRWEDINIQYLDLKGEVKVSNAVVWINVDLELNGVLWKGKLIDIISLDDPYGNPGARTINKFNSIPDLKAGFEEKTAVL